MFRNGMISSGQRRYGPSSGRRPRRIVRVIDPDGTGDYTSLASWYADMVSTYTSPVASNSIWRANCTSSGGTNDAGTSAFNTAIDTDSARYIHIEALPSDLAGTAWSASKYRVRINTAGPVLRFGSDYTRVIGLQIEQLGSGGKGIVTTGSNIHIEGCYFNGAGFGGTALQFDGGNNCLARNCIADNWQAFLGSRGFWVSSGSHRLEFCSAVRIAGTLGKNGFVDTPGTTVAINCLSDVDTNGFSGSFAGSGTGYNAAADASAPGGNSRQSQAFTFADTADFALHADDTGAQGHGTPISDVLYDIAGVLRDPVNPSIGACEVAV